MYIIVCGDYMKIAVFDFDGTLTTKDHNIWDRMWAEIDARDIDLELFNGYKNGDFDYLGWCERITETYKERGFSLQSLQNVSGDFELVNDIEKTLLTLKENGYTLFIISGGVTAVINRELGHLSRYFNEIYANDFLFDADGKLTEIIPTPYDDHGKKVFIDECVKKYNVSPKDITFIGNGDNDEYVHLSGCHTICINPGKRTRHSNKDIWHNVIYDSNSLTDILKYFSLEEKKERA